MIKKIFGQKKEVDTDKDVLVAALLIHAAKIDENYTEKEKKIIKKALTDLNNISEIKAEEILAQAEKKEEESNQIVEFTKEIKKHSMESRLKIIEVFLHINL